LEINLKPVLVVLIALATLALGFFLGGAAGGALGGYSGAFGGATVGSAFGACSVLEDAVEQNHISKETGLALYARFASRVDKLFPGGKFSLQQEMPYSKCQETLEKFRSRSALQDK
jgi:hypothetical protein